MLPPPGSTAKKDFPYWLAAAVLIAVAAGIYIATNNLYAQVFATVATGIGITLFVTVVAFTLASALGLGIALMGMSGSKSWCRSPASTSRSSAAYRSSCCCSGSLSPAHRRWSPAGMR